MDEVIQAVKLLLYAVLAHAPEEDDCTDAENEMYADMQNLRESIERWEEDKAEAYLNIEDDEDVEDYCVSIRSVSTNLYVVEVDDDKIQFGFEPFRKFFYNKDEAANVLHRIKDMNGACFTVVEENN